MTSAEVRAREAVAQAVRESVRIVRDATKVAEIEAALRSGDVTAAVDAIQFELGEDFLRHAVLPSTRAIYEQAAMRAKSSLADLLDMDSFQIRFDIFNPEAVAWAGQSAGDLVTTWGSTSREALRDLVQRTLFDGSMSPRDLSRMIYESGIGLTDRDLRAVENYRRGLEDNPELDYSDARISELTSGLSERYETARADMIAHTEVMQASREGSQELWRQAFKQGLVDPEVAVQDWLLSNNPCDDCKAVVEAGGTARLGEEFPADGGMGPPLHPHCECDLVLRPFGRKEDED